MDCLPISQFWFDFLLRSIINLKAMARGPGSNQTQSAARHGGLAETFWKVKWRKKNSAVLRADSIWTCVLKIASSNCYLRATRPVPLLLYIPYIQLTASCRSLRDSPIHMSVLVYISWGNDSFTYHSRIIIWNEIPADSVFMPWGVCPQAPSFQCYMQHWKLNWEAG